MSLKPGKRDINKLAQVLDQDYETVEEAASAALLAAWEIYETKAKFAVAGQVRYSRGWLDADDERASKVILGPFGTLKQAQAAGESLAYSSRTGEESKWWAVPMWHGTPAAWYEQRKQDRMKHELYLGDMGDTTPMQMRDEMRRLWMSEHPGADRLPPHLEGMGWDGLDEFMEWREDMAHRCGECGQDRREDAQGAPPFE